jgi:hypothetical protein
MDDLAAFARLIDALRPWLGHVVIVGGWAHRLHRLHPLSHPPQYAPIRTKDADVAFSISAPLAGNIGAALKAAGFHEEFSGEHTPPITHYLLGDDDKGFFVEFLAPLPEAASSETGHRTSQSRRRASPPNSYDIWTCCLFNRGVCS